MSRRQQKAAAALSEDGFALHPLDEIEDSALWQSLAQFLRTSDAAQLGKGKDVTRSFGEYNALRLASAWRVEHPRARRRYDAAKEDIIEDMNLLDRKGVHALGTLSRGLPVACMPSKPATGFGPVFRMETVLLYLLVLQGRVSQSPFVRETLLLPPACSARALS